ncbi:MAG: DUF1887 family CARF protein, partial [Bacteroidota bacterium]|nr:DUF1887 family CARF protein [Bacteroidota bacterium]
FSNVVFKYKAEKNDKQKNEIDIVLTKGLKTVFIECKAGNVFQNHVYKLNSLKKYFLGPFGNAVLVTKYKPQPWIIEKCNDYNIKVLYGKHVKDIHNEIYKLLTNAN